MYSVWAIVICLSGGRLRAGGIARATATFDTLKFVRKLSEAGFEEKQAEGIAEAFKDAFREAELAIRRDLLG